MGRRYFNFLLFPLILLCCTGIQEITGFQNSRKTGKPEQAKGFSFDLPVNDGSSKYFLQSSVIISPVITESARGPFYNIFIGPGAATSLIPGEYSLPDLKLMADDVQSIALSALLFPFHSFP